MNIPIAQIQTAPVVSYILKQALGTSNVLGVSTGHYGTIAHLDDAASQQIAETVLASIGGLTIDTDKTQISADGLDKATLTINTADPALDWLLLEDQTILGQGTENAVAGVVTLEFSISDPGQYTIWVIRKQGNFASGKILVEAT